MRVLIADGRPKVRFALRILLEQQPNICVTAQVARPQELVIKTQETSPDVLLLSWDLVGPETGDLITTLRTHCPDLQIVVLSGRPEARCNALQAGADAFVSKTTPPEHLLAAISACSLGFSRVTEHPSEEEKP